MVPSEVTPDASFLEKKGKKKRKRKFTPNWLLCWPVRNVGLQVRQYREILVRATRGDKKIRMDGKNNKETKRFR